MKTFAKIILFLGLIVTMSACSGTSGSGGSDPGSDTDPCNPTNPCQNGGTCKQDKNATNGYTCTCAAGFMGNKCEVKDPCNPTNPCQNNGTCAVDKTAANGYKCTCKKGYSGDTCELRSCNTYTAAKPACQNNGKCQDDATKGHTCKCSDPYKGDQCELSPCNPNPCQNGGTCKLKSTEADGYICKCSLGFDGKKCEQKAFKIKVKTSSANETFEILSDDSSAQFNVDWDGYKINNYTSSASYTFNSAGDHIISITGDYTTPKFNCFATGKLIEVVDWGNQKWKSMKGAFKNCTELTSVGSTIPDLSNVTDMSEMFMSAAKFNSDLNNWNVSNVTDMNHMFNNAKSFNKPLNNWDISKVTDMDDMFNNASNFNQDLTSWEKKAASVTKCANFASSSWTTGKPTKLGTCTP